MKIETLKKIVGYLLLTAVLLYVLTGYGITQFRIVEPLTLGLLTKSLSFKIHSYLIIPGVILLIVHLYLVCSLFKKLRKE